MALLPAMEEACGDTDGEPGVDMSLQMVLPSAAWPERTLLAMSMRSCGQTPNTILTRDQIVLDEVFAFSRSV